jgi:hypothetical protein
MANCTSGISIRFRIQPEALGRGLEPRDVAVVVGAEHVDRAFEAALELAQQVTQVGGEVRGDAVLAHHHAILVVAEGGGAEPGGAILLEQVAVGAQVSIARCTKPSVISERSEKKLSCRTPNWRGPRGCRTGTSCRPASNTRR